MRLCASGVQSRWLRQSARPASPLRAVGPCCGRAIRRKCPWTPRTPRGEAHRAVHSLTTWLVDPHRIRDRDATARSAFGRSFAELTELVSTSLRLYFGRVCLARASLAVKRQQSGDRGVAGAPARMAARRWKPAPSRGAARAMPGCRDFGGSVLPGLRPGWFQHGVDEVPRFGGDGDVDRCRFSYPGD